MVRIEVRNPEVKTRHITPQGKQAFDVFEQEAWFHHPDKPYPQEMTLRVEGPNAGYAAGSYQLAPQSIFVGRYGDLQISRQPTLVRIEAKQQAKEAS